jgi:hypothetical protein
MTVGVSLRAFCGAEGVAISFPNLWVGKCVSEANLVSNPIGFESELAKPISILGSQEKKRLLPIACNDKEVVSFRSS